jgi:hypothetical protein
MSHFTLMSNYVINMYFILILISTLKWMKPHGLPHNVMNQGIKIFFLKLKLGFFYYRSFKKHFAIFGYVGKFIYL